MAGANAEPSMEDILSSIKRIIAEDSEAALSTPRVKRSVGLTPMAPPAAPLEDDEPDVLELTDELPSIPAIKPLPDTEPASAPQPESDPVATTKRAEPAAADVPEEKPVLVSPKTVEASRTSLAALSALVVKPEVPGSDTLEGMVREMLKPMLTEWLDANLPDVVERMVAQEIARITARG